MLLVAGIVVGIAIVVALNVAYLYTPPSYTPEQLEEMP